MKCRDEGEGRIEGAAEQGFSTNSFANLAVLWNNDRKDERGPDERVQTRGSRREGPDERDQTRWEPDTGRTCVVNTRDELASCDPSDQAVSSALKQPTSKQVSFSPSRTCQQQPVTDEWNIDEWKNTDPATS